MSKIKYYSLKPILSKNAVYNMVIGERSNGKTYAVLEYAIERYAETGEQLAIVRRWHEDFVGKRGQTMFAALVDNGVIARVTGGVWDSVYYYGAKWYFCRYEDSGARVTAEAPFAYGFSLASMEHDKSTSYPRITTILFDEFITRTMYLTDEFVIFMNTLSTIIRDRKNVKIFMLGNTVNKYCPYFSEMGLTHIKKMSPGDIDIYRYGDSDLTVAVEYAKPNKNGKESDFYFAFDNPKLSMITGGEWEIDVYPHLPCKYRPSEVLYTFFIIFSGDVLQCEIVKHEGLQFLFVHRKTGGIKYPDKDIVFSPDYDARRNRRRDITRPFDKLGVAIYAFFQRDKVFYADNECGEIMRNYLQWCGR